MLRIGRDASDPGGTDVRAESRDSFIAVLVLLDRLERGEECRNQGFRTPKTELRMGEV